MRKKKILFHVMKLLEQSMLINRHINEKSLQVTEEVI